MANKSYNVDALQGKVDYDDKQFQSDYRGWGVDIPDSLLYTPELNIYVAKAERDKAMVSMVGHMNPATKAPYTEEEANYEANKTYKKVINDFSQLSGVDLWKLGA